MRIAVVGSGYVGLVTGACLAETGNDIVCADIDAGKIARLKQNDIPIYEPGLEDMVRRNQTAGRLSFTTEVGKAIEASKVVFIAVGTPPGEDGSADLQHVLAVAKLIGKHLNEHKVVVTKSTVPVGTSAKVRAAVAGEAPKVSFSVCSNPEFLKEGAAVDDFMKPDRIIIGTDSQDARDVMSEIYSPFVRTGNPILFMDLASAEVTKYAANAMLATRISFMNQIANFCEQVGADVNDVRIGIGSDRRIGNAFLFPGPGYGGSCFPKDVKALIRTGRQVGLEFDLLEAVETVNERQKSVVLQKVTAALGELKGKTVGLWGLAFKAETDDMRESPAIPVIEGLLKGGARVQVNDPKAHEHAHRIFGDQITYADDPYKAAEGADALAILTEWRVYRNPDFDRLLKLLKQPVLVDGRNLYDPAKMRRLGFRYSAIGRRIV